MARHSLILDPREHPEIFVETSYLPDDSFKGGQLILSILGFTLRSWVSLDNEPFWQIGTTRNDPYNSIVEATMPMPELVPGLRPLDVGIAHCLLLQDVLK